MTTTTETIDHLDFDIDDNDDKGHLGWPGVPLYTPQKALCGAKLKGVPVQGKKELCQKCLEVKRTIGPLGSMN